MVWPEIGAFFVFDFSDGLRASSRGLAFARRPQSRFATGCLGSPAEGKWGQRKGTARRSSRPRGILDAMPEAMHERGAAHAEACCFLCPPLV